ncbi:hypothetical protein HOE04_00730 [archaeon]|jgi:hypothetical protein|nr:hypothetical protein [archaeon]
MTINNNPPIDFATVMRLLDRIEHFEPEVARRECETYKGALSIQYQQSPTQANKNALLLVTDFQSSLYPSIKLPEETA